MKLLYWNKVDKCYISYEDAKARGMHGVDRHHFVTKEDLVKGNGLPSPVLEHVNSKFFIGYEDKRYRIISPANNEPNILTLSPWAGEVVVVDSNNGKGVIDVNTGELLIPFDKSHYAIYPISTDYFVVVAPDIDHKKIVNRKNQTLDTIYGTYSPKEGELFRRVLSDVKDKQYKCDGRFSLKSLKKRDATMEMRQQYIQSIKSLKSAGVGLHDMYKLLQDTYHNKPTM